MSFRGYVFNNNIIKKVNNIEKNIIEIKEVDKKLISCDYETTRYRNKDKTIIYTFTRSFKNNKLYACVKLFNKIILYETHDLKLFNSEKFLEDSSKCKYSLLKRSRLT